MPDVEGKPCFFHKAKRQHVRKWPRTSRRPARRWVEFGHLNLLPLSSLRSVLSQPSSLLSGVFAVRGPWRMIEIFTVTMAVGMAACARAGKSANLLGSPALICSRRPTVSVPTATWRCSTLTL